MTSDYKPGGLPRQKRVLSQLRRLEVQNQGASRAALPPAALGEMLPGLCQLLVAPSIPGLGGHHSNLCLRVYLVSFPVSVPQIPRSFLL